MSETKLQIQCIRYLNYQYNDFLYFHVPNGGYRDSMQASILKKMGVKAGIPDLIIFGKEEVTFVELKVDYNRLSPAQEEIKEKIESLGYKYYTVRTFEEFRSIRFK